VCAEYVPRPSGVFGGRATVRWPPPLAGPWKFFTGDFIWKGAFFAIFQQELQHSTMFDGYLRFQISEKWANLRFPLNIQKQKVFQLQGDSPPWPPDQGLCPGPRWGLSPQTPVIGSRSTRSPWPPPLPNPKYATAKAPNKCVKFEVFRQLEWSHFSVLLKSQWQIGCHSDCHSNVRTICAQAFVHEWQLFEE